MNNPVPKLKRTKSKLTVEDVQKRLINLMLKYPDAVASMIARNLYPPHFVDRFQALIIAIYEVYGSTERLLTDTHFREWLIRQGGRGDITIAMQVYHDCKVGVHHSNALDDLDLYADLLHEHYAEREGISAMAEFNDNVHNGMSRTDAYVIFSRQLAEITPKSTCRAITLSGVKPKAVDWLWENKIPVGKLTVFQGMPGQGKSLITLDVAARVSSGTNMPNTIIPTEKGDVLIVSYEDGIADTIVPRLSTFDHCDMDRIHCLDQDAELLDLSASLAGIRNIVKNLDNPRLIVLDPISAYMGDINSHEDASVRRVLGPVCKLAEKFGVAIIGIMHLTKDTTKDLLHRGLGSGAFMATARSGFMIGLDKEGERRFSHIKANLCKLSGTMTYAIQDNMGIAKLQWGTTVSYDDPATIFAPKRPIEDAQEWLAKELKDGAIDSKLIFKKAESQGFSEKTLNRAKKAMGIKPKKKGLSNGWEWGL